MACRVMIYEEEIIVSGKVPKFEFQPVDVWEELGRFLRFRGYLGAKYKVGLAMKKNGNQGLGVTKLLPVDSIAKELRIDEGEAILSLWQPKVKGISDLHRISFHTKHGMLDMSGRFDSFPNEWDSFFMTSNFGEHLVNVLISARS